MQQKDTSIIIGVKKGAWEMAKIAQAKRDSKIVWETIKEVLGKTGERMNEYIYIEKIKLDTE